MMILDKIYKIFPNFAQNGMITLFNILAYKKRYGKHYKKFLDFYKTNNNLTDLELRNAQKKRYESFVINAVNNSNFYNKLYEGIPNFSSIEAISKLPIVKKEDLRSHLDAIYTIPKSKGIHSKTGGTTGKSLEVLFTPKDLQERFALLDNFRSKYGYKLGKKTAWFSGKNLLTDSDIKKNRFWKTDYLYNVRYYSTFQIKEDNLLFYINDLIEYSPEYMVGFPSTMSEIAKFGLRAKIDFPKNKIKAVFTTAETLTKEIRNNIETFFKAKIYDQYASSEGAPFMFECSEGIIHLELQSGVFEVLDERNIPTNEGRLIVTSFTTSGTPLIRYDIGDRIALSHTCCACGNRNPIVKEIQGRIDDYIFSEQTGKVNLGNISNCLKGVYGIVKFQIVQNSLDNLDILIVKDEKLFTSKDERLFIQNIVDRVGNQMIISTHFVKDIHEEKSGKYRLIKNNLNK